MYTDPIADMLTRIRNASYAGKTELVLPYSKFKFALAKLLKDEGFIEEVLQTTGRHPNLRISLKKGSHGSTMISGLKRVSTPGQRIYVSKDKLPRIQGGLGLTVVSTSKGLMSDRQARKENLGGEIICQVW